MNEKKDFRLGIDPTWLAAIENSNDLFLIFNFSGTLLFKNHGSEEFLPNNVSNIQSAFPEDHEFLSTVLMEKSKKGGKSNKLVTLGEGDDAILLEMSFMPLKSCETGQINYFLAFGRNTVKAYKNKSKTKELEKRLTEQSFELKESNSKYREAQKIGRIGSWHFDLATQDITWSEQMYNIFPEDIENGEPPFERHKSTIHPEDVAHWEETVGKCIEDGRPYEMIFRVIHDDGKIVWVRARGKGIQGQDGRLIALFGTCQDVTEEKRLIEEKDFVLSNMKVGVWKWNVTTGEIMWDINMCELYGIAKEDFGGDYSEWVNRLHPEDRDITLGELTRELESKREFDFTFRIITPAGQVKYLGSKGKIERDQAGSPVSVYGINYDKTAEEILNQKLEEEKVKMIHSAKLATLGEMAAGIAHEINNPLTIISGCSSIISHDKIEKSPEMVIDTLTKIQSAVDRIAKIVKGLRKFSRQSDGLVKKNVEAELILNESIELTATKAKRCQVDLRLESFNNFQLKCDDIQIQQILINLINNGIDATKGKEEAWVEVKAWQGEYASFFIVMDSGNGIAPDVAEKLFNPFFTTKEVGRGTGLGLSIAQGIAREHGGELIYSTMDGHTAFLLTLPIEDVSDKSLDSSGPGKAA